MKIKIAGIQTDSVVDGPGVRLAIYVQGCSHCCAGCHNPDTHDPAGGYDMSIDQITAVIEGSSCIDGVTISGGEPFEQAASVAALADEITKLGLDLVLYSGYTFEELLAASAVNAEIGALLRAGSLLIDGPFIIAEQDYSLPYRGSCNQRIIDLPRSMKDGNAVLYGYGVTSV